MLNDPRLPALIITVRTVRRTRFLHTMTAVAVAVVMAALIAAIILPSPFT